ncbi:MAG: RDD family protein [Pseudomonadota bacterium]
MIPDPDLQPEFYDSVLIKRAIAWAIDTLIILVLCVLLLPFTGFVGIFVILPMLALVGFIYRAATIASGSATWGMRLVALEFRDSQDMRFDGRLALLHTLGYSICIAMTPLQVISIVLMCTTQRNQGLVDLILGSVALNLRQH